MEAPSTSSNAAPATTPPKSTPSTPPKAPANTRVSAYEHLFRQVLNECNRTAKLDLYLPASSSPPNLTTPPTSPPRNKTNGNTNRTTNGTANGSATHNEAHEIATAKMLNYCIRILHAHGWHPPTVLRAMALQESGLERGMKATMYQAMRERRKELSNRRSQEQDVTGKETVADKGAGTVNGSHVVSEKSERQTVNGRNVSGGSDSGSAGGNSSPVGTIKSASI